MPSNFAMTNALDTGTVYKEDDFRRWYADIAIRTGIDPNPDDPRHFYDYRRAFQSGAEPELGDDGVYHFPSTFKYTEEEYGVDHPNRFVNGLDTVTGQPQDVILGVRQVRNALATEEALSGKSLDELLSMAEQEAGIAQPQADHGEQSIDELIAMAEREAGITYEPEKPVEARTMLGGTGDIGVSLAKGVVGVGEAAVGLADIVSWGWAGKMLEKAGYNPDKTREVLDQLYTEAQQKANKKVQEAKGFLGTAEALAKNPSVILHQATESFPSMLGGGGIARELIKRGVLKGIGAAAAGEGAISAGQSAEQIRQKAEGGLLPPAKAGAAVASGTFTGLIAMAGGRIAQKLGFADPDVMLAGLGSNASQKGIVKRIVQGGISEGVFEELPQSAQEQVWQNAALGNPLLEGVPESAVQGMAAGGLMGVGANIPPSRLRRAPEKQPEPGEVPRETPVAEGAPVDEEAVNRMFQATREDYEEATGKKTTPEEEEAAPAEEEAEEEAITPAEGETLIEKAKEQIKLYKQELESLKGDSSNKAKNRRKRVKVSIRKLNDLIEEAQAPEKARKAYLRDKERYGLMESIEGEGETPGYVPSKEVKGEPTPYMGPTPFEQLKGMLTGKKGRMVEEKAEELAETPPERPRIVEQPPVQGEVPAVEAKPKAKPPTSDDLLASIKSLQPPGQDRALVSTSELRDKYPDVSKEDFDKAILGLSREGKVALHHHDFPASLTPDKREKMPRDEQGAYYVGVVPVAAEKKAEEAASAWKYELTNAGRLRAAKAAGFSDKEADRISKITWQYLTNKERAKLQEVREQWGEEEEEAKPEPKPELKASEATAEEVEAELDRQVAEMEKKEEKKEEPKEELPSWADKKVGVNAEGTIVYESKGNRVIRHGNFKNEAPRPLIANGQVLPPYSPKELYGAGRTEFLTKEELEQFKSKEKPRSERDKQLDKLGKDLNTKGAGSIGDVSYSIQARDDNKGFYFRRTENGKREDIGADLRDPWTMQQARYQAIQNAADVKVEKPKAGPKWEIGDYVKPTKESGLSQKSAGRVQHISRHEDGSEWIKTTNTGNMHFKASDWERAEEPKEAPKAEEKPTPAPTEFKKGDRVVVTRNGQTRHGSIIKANTFFIGSVYGGGTIDKVTSFDVQTDEGARWLAINQKELEAEKERPTAVIPDVEVRPGEFKEPDDVLASYRWYVKSAKDKLAASARARKNASKGAHQREAAAYQKDADLDRAAFEKWAEANPEALKALKEKGVNIPWETAAPAVKPTVAEGQKPKIPLTYHETTHAKKNVPLYVVAMGERVSREDFVALRAKASSLGGYWSRYAQHGAIPGFQFENKGKALEMMQAYGYETGETKPEQKSTTEWMQDKSLELRTQKEEEKEENYVPTEIVRIPVTDTKRAIQTILWSNRLDKPFEVYGILSSGGKERLGSATKHDRPTKPLKYGYSVGKLIGPKHYEGVPLERYEYIEAHPPKTTAEQKPIQVIESPEKRWDDFVDSLTPNQQALAGGLLVKMPRNVDRQIATIQAVLEKPTAAEKATETAKHIANVLDGVKKLNKIIGDAGVVGIGPEVDLSVYEQMKPVLQEMWSEAQLAGKSVKEFVSLVLQELQAKGVPYFRKFIREEIGHEPASARMEHEGEAEVGEGRPEGQEPGPIPSTEEVGEAGGIRGGPGAGALGGLPGRVEPGALEPSTGKAAEKEPDRVDEGLRGGPSHPLGELTTSVSGILTKGSDYVIPVGGLERKGGWKTAAKNNLAAIETYKKILAENRPATKEEQDILVKYVGWGASELANKMFPGYSYYREVVPDRADEDWRPLVDRLVSLLTPEEIATAARSTQYAHYTSEKVIRSIYKALVKFGFDGGKILEPGSGIGHFIGLLPESIRAKCLYTGIEMDSVSAGIAKLLYPNHNILAQDFTKTLLPQDFFDAAIGNPPFGAIAILSDPEYRKFRFKLHNFFFAKSLDRVKPGGVLTFVTSHFTMDSQGKKVRDHLSKTADFIGAIRLPQTAFKQNAGTEVVTDVIFLKKRVKGDAPAGEAWLELAEVDTPEGKVLVNEYFAAHPEMVLGRHSLQGSMRGKNEYTVLPIDGDIEALFDKAVENLPEGIYSKVTETSESAKQRVFERDYNPANKKEGGLYIGKDGKLKIVNYGSGVDIEAVETKLKNAEKIWLKDYVPLRNALKQAHFDQLTNGDWETSLKTLQTAYKKFTKKHGRLSQYTLVTGKETDEDGNIHEVLTRRYKYDRLLRIDAEGSNVAALEKVTEDGDIIESPILKERSIYKPADPKIETVADALAVSLNAKGSLDLANIGEMMKMTEAEVIEKLGDLIFKDPSKGYTLADEYLSGNVVRKLEEAQEAAKIDEEYSRNVEALKKVQPEALKPEQITVSLGATWIPNEYVEQFGKEVLGLREVEVTHHPATNAWTVRGSFRPQGTRSATAEYGTADRGPNELLESALNNRAVRITRVDDDKKTYTDTVATTAANEKLKKLKEKFSSWVWLDGNRAKDLLDRYNHDYNNLAPRKFDGSHLTLPGATSLVKLHDHQKRAIWRIIQTGNSYLAHAVGAGKTFVMISAGMEMKRLGLISKPIYVVPKHMLGQFSREFNELYPMAHVMVADEENFHTENRRRFVARATLNNPDAIIVTHSAFGIFSLKEETIKPVRDKFLADMRMAWEDMKDEGEPHYLIKQMEKRIQETEQRFDSMISRGDKAITFEEMGVDYMFIDEAHEFRKLDYITNQKIKGIDPVGSKKATDLYIKTLWMERQNPGRSHTFASGTPITNTMGELYSVMRFFDQQGMEQDGIDFFDAWSSQFARAAVGYEMNSAGRYQAVERFSRFMNIPELMSRVRRFMDVLTLSQLANKVKLPEIKGGRPEIVISETIPELKDYQDNVLQPRIEASLKWKPSPDQKGNPDPMINIITDGRLASIDMRFVNHTLPNNPNSKLNKYIDGIIETYFQTKDNEYLDIDGKVSSTKGAAQVCFYNTGFGEAVIGRRGFNSRQWVMTRLKEAGIPVNHVAWIEDYGSADKKEALFKDLRSGKKRILFGSAKKIGTGMNIQNRLSHLHYLDAPWYPADVEQPLGRIVRQGNQNEVVDIRWYATKGSYDATMWQLVSMKSKFIEKAFLGEKDLRTMDDLSESSQYEMAAALASGDERVILLVKKRGEVEKFGNLKQEYENNLRRFKYEIDELGYRIETRTQRLEILKRMQPYVPDYVKFESGRVGKNTFDKREEFNDALIGAISRREGLDKETGAEVLVGELNGYKIYHQTTYYSPEHKEERKAGIVTVAEDWKSQISLRFEKGLEELWYPPDVSAIKLINFLNKIDSDIANHERDIEEFNERIKELDARRKAPFEFEREYGEAIAEVARLEQELTAEGEAIPSTRMQAMSQMSDVEADENRTKLLKNFANAIASTIAENDEQLKEDLADALIEGIHTRYIDPAYDQALEILIDQKIPVADYEDSLETVKRRFLAREAYLDYPAVIGEYPEFGAEEEVAEASGMGVGAGFFPNHPSAQEIRSFLDPIIKKLPGLPEVNVVEHWEELPGRVQQYFEKSTETGTYAAIFLRFNTGRQAIYIIADRQESVKTALRSLWHESGHFALRKALTDWSPAYNTFLDDLYESEHKERIIKIGNGYGFNLNTQKGRRKAADEFWARVCATQEFSVNDSWFRQAMDRFVEIVRDVLKAIGIDVRMTNAEIRNMMRRAYMELEGGPAGEGARAGQQKVSELAGETAGVPAPIFYSQMQRVLGAKLPNAGTAEQFRKMVNSWAQKGEFKQDELNWSGVDEWLGDRGAGRVTKQEVLDFVRANEVQITEITKEGQSVQAEGVQPFGGGPTKFFQWTLPGGENYRELLLTLPQKRIFKPMPKYEDWLKTQDWYKSGAEEDGPEARRLYAQWQERAEQGQLEEGYRSAHWSEPNVLAHVRFNTRTGPNGERILFIEEVQSDWHQEGRKKGYRAADVDLAALKAKARELSRSRDLANIGTPEFQRVTSEYLRTVEQYTEAESGVPPAPFSKTWPEFAMKRMLRYAAENGYDRVAWTTGEQQAERYDLSKHISRIAYEQGYDDDKNLIDEYDIQAFDLKENKVLDEQDVDLKRIEELVGKEIAQKIANRVGENPYPDTPYREWKELKGLDLKVGGEGMKGFYDTMLPAAMNKYAKKWGARVEDIEIETGPLAEDAEKELVLTENDTVLRPVHSLPVTEAMRESVLFQGQPMFEKIFPADVNTPEFKKWFGKSKVVDKDGKPLQVYHGTGNVFEAFDTRRKKSEDRMGAYFTESREGVNAFARHGKASVIPAYLSVQKPLDLRGKSPKEIADALPFLSESVQRSIYMVSHGGTYTILEQLDKSQDLVPKLKARGYDGIAFDHEVEGNTWVIFKPTQAKSIFNRGTWSDRVADISGQKMNEEAEYLDKNFSKEALGPIKGFRKLWKARGARWREQKPDFTVLDRIASVPSHHFEKVEAMQKMFESSLKRPDTYFELLNAVTKSEDGGFFTQKLADFQKKDPEAYEKLKNYLVSRDRNQIGYKVLKDKETGQYLLFNPKKQKVGTFDSEIKAWGKAIAMEAQDYRAAGASDLAVESLIGARMITHRGFEVLFNSMRNLMRQYQSEGMIPSVTVDVEGKAVEVNLAVEMARMGDIRGYFFPRIRRSGRFMMTATKQDSNPIMEFFDTKIMMARRQVELEKQGYKIEKDLSPKLPEDVFQMAGSTIGMQAVINKALEKVHGEGLTLEDFGLSVISRMVKPGVRDFVVTGPTSKNMTPIFKELGGKFYSAYAGETRAWHFINAGPKFEKRLAKALANSIDIVDLETEKLFAQALSEQVANVIKGRGYLSHRIQRRPDKGVDVWLGYEEDPAIALAKYARGLAAGEAKRINAIEMIRAFTGTDESWYDFKARTGGTYEEYLEQINERRVDPSKQPNAFKEGRVFMEDMLRNEEWIDRAIGTIKGAAVLKYLGFRVAAPVVNLTALVTSVPGAMNLHGDIPINESFRLLAQASHLYRRYLKKGEVPAEMQQVFATIERKGWDKAQFNQEALAVLESKFGRGWNKLIDASMWMFGVTEQLNRAATIAGSYLGVRRSHPELSMEEALNLSKKISDRAHGVYRKVNLPHYVRGPHVAAQIAKMFYVFRTFSHNYLLTMKEAWGSGWTPEHGKAFAYMLLSPAVFAGAGATIATPILKALAQAVGIGGDDPEEEVYAWLDENLGEYVERAGRYGLFGLLGVNVKGSLQISITDIPTTIPEVLGAPGSVISDLYYGVENLSKGNVLKGVEELLPNAAATIIRGYREATEGVTTRRNAPVFYGKEPLVADTVEAIYRGLSFNPARIAGIREKLWHEKEIETGYRERRGDIYSQFYKFYLRDEAERSEADYIDILNQVEQYNEEIRRQGLEGVIPFITGQSIRTNLRRTFIPPKKERLRAANE